LLYADDCTYLIIRFKICSTSVSFIPSAIQLFKEGFANLVSTI